MNYLVNSRRSSPVGWGMAVGMQKYVGLDQVGQNSVGREPTPLPWPVAAPLIALMSATLWLGLARLVAWIL